MLAKMSRNQTMEDLTQTGLGHQVKSFGCYAVGRLAGIGRVIDPQVNGTKPHYTQNSQATKKASQVKLKVL